MLAPGRVTDSFGDSLDPVTDGLGFLPFSNGVHDDLADQPRRQRFRELIAARQLPAGYATEDGVGLHYVGTELREAVGIVADRSAWHVAPDGAGGYRETEIPARYGLPSREVASRGSSWPTRATTDPGFGRPIPIHRGRRIQLWRSYHRLRP